MVAAWGVSAELTPAISGAAEVTGYVGRGPLAIAAGALWIDESEPSDDRYAFGLTAFRLGACYLAGSPTLRGGGCLSGWAGATHAVAHDLELSRPGNRFFGALSLGALGSASIAGPVHGDVAVDLFVPLIRRRYTVASQAPAWQQPVVGAAARIGIGVHFW